MSCEMYTLYAGDAGILLSCVNMTPVSEFISYIYFFVRGVIMTFNVNYFYIRLSLIVKCFTF
jgi:hypothetical protein